jgi:hypothetical protein
MDGQPPHLRPLDSARHPFEIFVLWLGLVVSAPLLWGVPAPGSTTNLLGPALAHVWAWMLAAGCLTALTGAFWTWWGWLGRFFTSVRPTDAGALLIERVGLVAVGCATLIYTVGVLFAEQGSRGRFVAAGLVFALGLASFWRAAQIQRWVNLSIRDHEHR